MKKIFTKLVCVGMACFCMVSVMGQENKPVEKIVEEQAFLNPHEIELRAEDATEYWWPDSVEYYNSSGVRTSVYYYNKKNGTWSAASLNNSWILEGPYDTKGFSLYYHKVQFDEEGGRRFVYPSVRPSWYWRTTYTQNYKYNTVYDNKNNLILVEILSDNPLDGTYNFIEFHIKYNEKNNPVLIERYNYKHLIVITRYEYNAAGYMTLLEQYWNTDGKLDIIDGYPKETVEFDAQGRPVEMRMYRGSQATNSWLLDSYSLFHYSDGVSNEKIETLTPAVYINQDIMYVQAVRSETIAVYSIAGAKLYETAIQPGLNTINAANFPQGILFIRGSSGWVKKVIAK